MVRGRGALCVFGVSGVQLPFVPRFPVQVTRLLQSYFTPKIPAIKSRIEKLIDTEYLKRDDQDNKIYHYVA